MKTHIKTAKTQWQKVFPNLQMAVGPFADRPLYYTQEGNVIFVRIGNDLYVFEINKSKATPRDKRGGGIK